MAVCLDYQAVYVRKGAAALPKKFHVAAASLLLLSLAVKVWVKLETTDAGYSLARERQRTVDLDMQKRELDLQLSILKRPDMLANAARAKLGLSDHDPVGTIVIPMSAK